MYACNESFPHNIHVTVCGVTLHLYPQKAESMLDRIPQLAEHWRASIPKVLGSIPVVVRRIFQLVDIKGTRLSSEILPTLSPCSVLIDSEQHCTACVDQNFVSLTYSMSLC